MSVVGGYASRSYQVVEDLAEQADRAHPVDRDQAIRDYVQALHALAAIRKATDGPPAVTPLQAARRERKRILAEARTARKPRRKKLVAA